jgi:predicted nuclease of predicted toxin-antitoxin system
MERPTTQEEQLEEGKRLFREQQERLLREQQIQVRLLFDQNLPPSLRSHLRDLFPDSAHVRDVAMMAGPDSVIWNYAKAFNFAIVTKDKDFAEHVRAEGPPPSVIQIRAGNCCVASLTSMLREDAAKIVTHVQFGGGLLEVGADVRQVAV